MKNLIIVHQKPYSNIAQCISETLDYLDKTYNDPVIAVDHCSGGLEESWKNMMEAYEIDDFDFYIMTIQTSEKGAYDIIQSISGKLAEDTLIVSGDTLVEDPKTYAEYRDILAHITEPKA